MAEKPEKEKRTKRPRHTQLVVPGSGKKGRYKQVAKDRLGRSTPPEATQPAAGGQAAQPPGVGQSPAAAKAAAPAAQRPGRQGKTGGAQSPKADGQKAGPVKTQNPENQGAPAETLPPEQAAAAPGGTPKNVSGKSAKLIQMPKRSPARRKPKKKLSLVRRKRRNRRIRALVVLVVAAVAVMIYASGIYLTWGSLLGDRWESLTINARPGEGFPTAFAMNGFIEAEPMGTGGFAVLGEREVALVTGSGRELTRTQHTYVQPGLSAGDTRVVVYGRGGREYIVQGRSKTILRGTTEMDIQFAEMSPRGWLLMATASRHASEVQVYGPTYDTGDPVFTWRDDGDKPIMADFHADNTSLVLGCVSAKNGALGSTIHVLRTDRDTPVASIRADGALLVALHYLDNNRILAVYDSFAALFNQQGEELARYEYGQRRLMNADLWDGNLALLFGGASQDTLHTVLLDGKLDRLFDVSAEALSGTSARVLADKNGAFLLQGQQVTAYNLAGQPAGSILSEEKTLTLTHGGQPLLLCSGTVAPLESLLAGQPPTDPAASDISRESASTSADASTRAGTSDAADSASAGQPAESGDDSSTG